MSLSYRKIVRRLDLLAISEGMLTVGKLVLSVKAAFPSQSLVVST